MAPRLFQSLPGLVMLVLPPVTYVAGGVAPTKAQEDAQAAIETLKDGQGRIWKKLREIKALLRRQQKAYAEFQDGIESLLSND